MLTNKCYITSTLIEVDIIIYDEVWENSMEEGNGLLLYFRITAKQSI